MPRDVAADGGRDMSEPIALGDEHLQELPAASEEGIQGVGGVVGQGPRLGAHPLGKERQDLRVDRVRFGELPRRPGKIAHLAGIGHDQREPCGGQGRHQGAFVPPPVASRPRSVGARERSRVSRVWIPASSLDTVHASVRADGDGQVSLCDVDSHE
jgi:hypothetical protein